MSISASRWLTDPGIRRCLFKARGILIELLCHAKQIDDGGAFTGTGGPLSPEEIAGITGNSQDAWPMVSQLITNGALVKRPSDGAYYCPLFAWGKTLTEQHASANALSGPVKVNQVAEVIAHYRKYHPRAYPGGVAPPKMHKTIEARFKEGWSVADLQAAIDGCHRSQWHQGDNPFAKKYDSLELIVRDSEHVQQFMEVPQAAGRLSPRAERTGRAASEFSSRLDALESQGASQSPASRKDREPGDAAQ